MEKRALDRDETDFMRDYIQEGVDRGETNDQIKARRRELAELFHCTLPQIVGAVAWKKQLGEEQLILEPLELPKLSDSNSTDSSLKTNQELQDRPDDQERKLRDENESEDNKDLEKANSERDYEKMDYDYEIKNRWRKIIQQNIQSNFPLINPEQSRVLFFPGRHCHEAAIYHELGIPGKNQVGFIKDNNTNVIADFRDAADRFGIDGRVGDIERACIGGIGRFNIVSLDFPGEICDKYSRICGRIELEDKAIIIVNTMGKREKEQAKVMLGLADKSVNAGAFRQRLDSIAVYPGSTPAKRELARQQFSSVFNEKSENVPESRTNNAHILTVGSMGRLQPRNWMFSDEIVRYMETHEWVREDKDPIRSLRSVATILSGVIGKNLAGALMRYSWDKTKINRMLSLASGGLFLDTVFCRPHMLSLKKFQYTSEGRSRSPFNTDIAVLDTPRTAYENLKRTAHFLLQCFLSEALRSRGSTWFETEFFVRTRQGWKLGVGGVVGNKDRLVFAADNKTVCELPMKTLFEDAEFHSDLVSQYSLEERSKQAMIPREIIQ